MIATIIRILQKCPEAIRLDAPIDFASAVVKRLGVAIDSRSPKPAT